MTRGIELGYNYSNNNLRGKWYSHKRATLVICSINIVVALYVLRSLYTSLYIYSLNDSQNVVKYTPTQIRKMEEAIQIRKASEPVELVKLVQEIKKELSNEENIVKLPMHLKHTIREEIIQRLRGLSDNPSVSEQREAVESWRKEKLEKLKQVISGKTLNSTVPSEEAGMLERAIDADWNELSEEIGLWIPLEIVNKEHDDKPEGAQDYDEEILAGPQLPPECHAEPHTDYGGAAVRWGLTHPKESAYDCCQACLDHAKKAQPDENKCNIWVYCPSETGCYSPDIYQHKHMECWLKYADQPKPNFKNKYSESYRSSHSNVPTIVPWISGVVTA